MAEKLVMPRLGQSMEEGTIVQWYKREGDSVRQGEPLLEVMTDKANIDVEATSDGVLRAILARADETVPVNAAIAVIGTADEEVGELLTDDGSRMTDDGRRSTGEGEGRLADAESHESQSAIHHPSSVSRHPSSVEPAPPPVHVSPRARRLADEHGIPVSALAGIGTGPQGRVIERDVANYVERQRSLERQLGAPEAPILERPARMSPLAARIADDSGVDIGTLAAGLPGSRIMAEDVRRRVESPLTVLRAKAEGELVVAEVIPFRGLRKLVAENVTRSRQTAPHVTLMSEVDMTECAAALARLRPEVERSHGVKLTYTDILVKAAARALADHPLCNAALVGDEIRVYSDKNIGVAVATEVSLIVPVVRSADRKGIGEISAELKQLADRCQVGKQTPDDLSGGTFTITNLGAFGVDSFDPVIVPPQSCILGVGRIAERPVAIAGQVVVLPMMNLCLSFDHRVLDGAPAARFLQRMKALLETPILVFA